MMANMKDTTGPEQSCYLFNCVARGLIVSRLCLLSLLMMQPTMIWLWSTRHSLYLWKIFIGRIKSTDKSIIYKPHDLIALSFSTLIQTGIRRLNDFWEWTHTLKMSSKELIGEGPMFLTIKAVRGKPLMKELKENILQMKNENVIRLT